jgi:hypothetical protein
MAYNSPSRTKEKLIESEIGNLMMAKATVLDI